MTDEKKSDNRECAGCKLVNICKQDCAETGVNRDKEIKAVLLCLVIPCVLLLVTVIAFSSLLSPLAGCLIGICSLAFYYGLYYLIKGKKEIR